MKTKNNISFKRAFPPIILSLIIMIALQSCKKPVQPERNHLMVQAVLGDVTVTADGIDKSPQPGDRIYEDSMIKTGQTSLLDVKYGDLGVIRINENSILLVSDLKQDSLVELNRGKIFVAMSKLKKDSKFQFKTSTTVAAIRGTSFRISADEKKSRIDVLAGTVKVNPVKEGKVVEEIEKSVEKDTAVEINEKDIEKIVEKKQEIETAVIQQETIEEIKMETRNIALDEKTPEAVKEEIKDAGIESIIVKVEPAPAVEEQKTVIEEMKKEEPETEKEIDKDKKADEERERIKKEKKEEKRKKREARLKKQAEEEIARKEKEQAERELKERAEKERIAREQKEKEARETEKKEQRVKNIPTL